MFDFYSAKVTHSPLAVEALISNKQTSHGIVLLKNTNCGGSRVLGNSHVG